MVKKILMPTVVISSTLFASFLLLIAVQGSKPVKIQVEGEEVFYGELKDFVSPGIGAAFSLGLGLAGAVVLGLQNSVHQSSALEKQLSHLQKLISEKDSQIEALKLSPSNPMLSQLNWFLEDDKSKNQTKTFAQNQAYEQRASAAVYSQTREEATAIQEEVTKPLVITNAVYETQPITINQLSVQTATSGFPSAQSVLGLTQKYGSKASMTEV